MKQGGRWRGLAKKKYIIRRVNQRDVTDRSGYPIISDENCVAQDIMLNQEKGLANRAGTARLQEVDLTSYVTRHNLKTTEEKYSGMLKGRPFFSTNGQPKKGVSQSGQGQDFFTGSFLFLLVPKRPRSI